MPEPDSDLSKLQRGGVALLLPPDSEISVTTIRTWQQTRVTAATWRLLHAEWSQPIYISGIYKSPGKSLTQEHIADDIHILADILTSAPADSLHIVAGDLNAHTDNAPDGTRTVNLPDRVSDGLPVNTMGTHLLGLLQSLHWTILTNRFRHGDTNFTRSVVYYGNDSQIEQNSCIDYFLVHDAHTSVVQGEAILRDSGSEIGRSDHNLCILDLAVPQADTDSDGAKVDMLPLPPRRFFNIRKLTMPEDGEENSTHQTTPSGDAYIQALSPPLAEWILRVKAASQYDTPVAQRQLSIDVHYENLLKIILDALESSVGIAETTSRHGLFRPKDTKPPRALQPALTQRRKALAYLNYLRDAF